MEKDELLVLYARAMSSAQGFESELAVLLSLYKIYSAGEPGAEPFTDEEFLALLFGKTGKTAGTMIKELFQEVQKYHQPAFPDGSVAEWLYQTVAIRNFLAHRYFFENAYAITDASRRPSLGKQLAECSRIFDDWQPAIEIWTDRLMRTLGLTDAQIAEIKAQAGEGLSKTRAETLENLIRDLERISSRMS